jgi:hypothetical protein
VSFFSSIQERGTGSTGGSTVTDPVFETIEKWWQAWCIGDLDTIDHLTGDPYICVSRIGELRIQGKRALMETVPKFDGLCPRLRWKIREPSIEHLDEAFICTYRLGFVTLLGRHGFAVKDKMTDVLVREGQRWLIVAHHGDLSITTMPELNPLVSLRKGHWLGDLHEALSV